MSKKNKVDKKFFDEGYSAYERGKRAEENPYSPYTVAYAAWEDGWYTACDDCDETERDY